MRVIERVAACAAVGLALVTGAQAQIIGGDGTPNTGYGAFYAWYDASDVTGTGVNPADGEVIAGGWADITGNERHLTNVIETPTFSAAGANGMPTVLFDGDGVWASRDETGFGWLIGGARTYLLVTAVDELTNGYVFDSSSSAGRNAIFAGQSSDPESWWLYSGSGAATLSAGISLGTLQVHAVVFDVDSSLQEHYINGQLVATGAEAVADMAGLILGARYTGGNRMNGQIAEFMVYTENLSDGDRGAVEGYLTDKYTIPSPAPLALFGLGALFSVRRRR